MNPMTCTDIDERIDLFAAGECDPPTAAAIRRHLTGCARCTHAEIEARQFMEMMDLRLQEPDRLQRLLDRIDSELKPAQVIPLTERAMPNRRAAKASRQRWFALAASILLPIGLGIYLTPPSGSPEPGTGKPELTLAMLPDRSVRGHDIAVPAPGNQKGAPEYAMAFVLDKEGSAIKAYQSQMLEAMVKTPPPLPPSIDMLLQVHNPTDRPMRLCFDDPRTELRLSLLGPGTVRLDAPAGTDPFAGLQAVDVPPGSSRDMHITRLISGSRAHPEYLYWTEPGSYRLRATLHVPVEAGNRTLFSTISGRPLLIRIER